MQTELASNRFFFRLALIGAIVAALGLSGCGRKGPLDPPPAASVEGERPQAQSGFLTPNQVDPTNSSQPADNAKSQRVPPPGAKKQFLLDPLLN